MIQYFNYHLILGLQYSFIENDIIIDLAVIPKGFTVEKILKQIKQSGFMFVNSFKKNNPIENTNRIIHNLYGK